MVNLRQLAFMTFVIVQIVRLLKYLIGQFKTRQHMEKEEKVCSPV